MSANPPSFDSTPIYLDYAATTPLDPFVLEKMLPFLSDPLLQGNASSDHFLRI